MNNPTINIHKINPKRANLVTRKTNKNNKNMSNIMPFKIPRNEPNNSMPKLDVLLLSKTADCP